MSQRRPATLGLHLWGFRTGWASHLDPSRGASRRGAPCRPEPRARWRGVGAPGPPPARSRAARSCPSLALAAVLVTGGVCELLDAGPRAAALLTAGQRVAAEGPGLAGGALGWHRARRADALARELVAQAAAAVAGCGEQRRAGGPSALLAGPRPQPGGARPGARRPQQLLRLGASLPESSHPWNLLGNQARPRPQAARGPTDGEAGLICQAPECSNPCPCFPVHPLPQEAPRVSGATLLAGERVDRGTHACSWGSPSSRWHSGSSLGR